MKKFIFTILALILIGLFAYHFIAANQAERNMDEAIQMQADALGNALSVQYSSIDISPFSGNINFSDGTIVRQSNIERFKNAEIDLDYVDFLKITFKGLKDGLRTIEEGTIRVQKASHLNRETLQEISSSEMNILYTGNLWDGLQYLAAGHLLDYNHKINITGTDIRYNKPQSTIGTFESDSAAFRYAFRAASPEQQSKNNNIRFDEIVWTPPAEFQKKYAFFIKGFGYPLDAIPVTNMGVSFSSLSNPRINIDSGQLETDLFTLQAEGLLVKRSSWAQTQLSPLTVTLTNASDEFKNVLSNIQQLLNLPIPNQNDAITFTLKGPLNNPQLTPQN
jgi:hypothetical protein